VEPAGKKKRIFRNSGVKVGLSKSGGSPSAFILEGGKKRRWGEGTGRFKKIEKRKPPVSTRDKKEARMPDLERKERHFPWKKGRIKGRGNFHGKGKAHICGSQRAGNIVIS